MGITLAANGLKENEERNRKLTEAMAHESSRLLPVIRGWVRDQVEAEDVLQDVFEEFVESYDIGEAIESLSAWLMTVARNKVFDRFRRKKTQNEYAERILAVAGEADPIASAASPEDELERKLLQNELKRAIGLLPTEQREVFVRHELEGQSFEEISKELKINLNTLLSRKRYAVQFLREQLKEYEDGNSE